MEPIPDDMRDYAAHSYRCGQRDSTYYTRPHPSWMNEWHLMGFFDAKGEKGWALLDTFDIDKQVPDEPF